MKENSAMVDLCAVKDTVLLSRTYGVQMISKVFCSYPTLLLHQLCGSNLSCINWQEENAI